MAMVNVFTIAAYRRIYWLRLIGLIQRSAATWRCVLHSSDEPGELSQWQCTATMTAPLTLSWLLLLLLYYGPVWHTALSWLLWDTAYTQMQFWLWKNCTEVCDDDDDDDEVV